MSSYDTLSIVASLAALLGFAFFAWRRLLRYLHIFQQDEYDAKRFLPWLITTFSFDKRVSAALILFAALTALIQLESIGSTESFLVAILFAAAGLRETDPRRTAKKKLVMTARARRIAGTGYVLTVGAGVVAAALGGSLIWLFAVQSIPLLLVLANTILKPIEARIQNAFRKAAEERLNTVNPTIIGITGSFGKTSVKHILGHILQMNTQALFTPGSVNTVMGISRIINEQLRDNCRYFLVEMGAYGIGSIARLCKFTPPDHGIITSIGEAHYERFKDLETVARAKFELAEAVGAQNGLMIVDESVLERTHAKQFAAGKSDSFVIVGDGDNADIRVLSISQGPEGLTVRLIFEGEEFVLFAPLFGIHHGRNMALAFTMAVKLGFAPERIVTALRTTPQIAHRLEVKRHPSGATLIDDAYNANPDGILNGLQLLQTLKTAKGRRILVTPGVAELGTRHDDVHRRLGEAAAQNTDITLAVRGERIPTFIQAFKSSKSPDGHAEILEFPQFAQAQTWMNENLRTDDVILIANDLPDLLEHNFVS
ncbi:MAG: Mur ligase family protein [Hyphomicrobiaceae bacterium]